MSDLAAQWRAANARIKALSASEPAVADSPAITDLPTTVAALGQAVVDHPVTKQSFGLAPITVKLVELEKLVVFQRTVNLTYAAQLRQALGENPTEEDLFHFALPTDGRYDPAVNAAPIGYGPIGPLAFAAVSPSADLRVLKSAMLDPSQVAGFDTNGRATQIIALAVGYGANYLSAMRVRSRLILKNGTHRAYALLTSGQTLAPILVEELPEGEEKEHLPPDVQADLEGYLTGPRPPILRDYLDEDLRMVVHVRRNLKSIRVALNYEEGGAPGA